MSDESFSVDHVVYVEVRACARCGGDHKRLRRREFLPGREAFGCQYWMRCPETGDPILLKAVVEQERGA